MPTEVVADHAELARKFLERSRGYLAQGDLHQASEKGWGAASHIVKAIAKANGWEYEHHDQFDKIIVNARQRYRLWDLPDFSNAAHSLHHNYYMNSFLLDASLVERRIDSVEKLVSALEPHVT